MHTPMALQAPESFFGEDIRLPADVWALGCTIFDVFGKFPLFETFRPNKDSILFEMVEILGKLPHRWWQKWDIRSYYCFADGTRNINMITKCRQEARPLAVCIQEI